MDNSAIIALVVSIVALAGFVFLFIQGRKTRKLKSRFGPEYDRVIEQEGSVRRAEAVLDERQKRVAKYQIRPLTREERVVTPSKWRSLQGRFVDDPKATVSPRADWLVRQAMGARGYPITDFEKQAADLSVDHPATGEYRVAREIAVRSERGQATTENLRLAMEYYRSLSEEIADTRAA
jgi:hypothetical protein